jgi:N-acyl-D-aspartate/D-glutamate deacylase
MRSEGNRLVEAVEELIRISREAGIPAEIYHLKAAGQANWPKMDQVIAKVDAARREGLKITADMYTYTAGATGLDAAMPPWVLDGGPLSSGCAILRCGRGSRRRSAPAEATGRTCMSLRAHRTA